MTSTNQHTCSRCGSAQVRVRPTHNGPATAQEALDLLEKALDAFDWLARLEFIAKTHRMNRKERRRLARKLASESTLF